MAKIFVVAGVCVVLSGCAGFGTTVPVGLDDAVRGIEADVRKLGYLSISDLLSDNPANAMDAEKYIRAKQCFFGRSNPLLVFALQSNLTFEIKGVFTQEGSFKISGIPTPVGEVGVKSTSQAEQKLSWPVILSSLSALPDQYFDARVKVLGTPGLTKEQQAVIVAPIVTNYQNLKAKVTSLETSFNINTCPKPDRPAR